MKYMIFSYYIIIFIILISCMIGCDVHAGYLVCPSDKVSIDISECKSYSSTNWDYDRGCFDRRDPRVALFVNIKDGVTIDMYKCTEIKIIPISNKTGILYDKR